ncbi:ATP-binding protein [Thalassotalea atypica]|uniref:ATP-binding protein n=1 Tax=Thalassotalea atypica TaxID=2054316 RepID=UPI0025742C49|nr:ATP-binding protein [Thalassotalea atypica]
MLTVIALPILAFALSQAFEEHIKAAIKNELIAYSYSILAVAEPIDNQLFLPEQLLENQFNVIDSGLYALVFPFHLNNNANEDEPLSPLWRSASALALDFKPSVHPKQIGIVEYVEQIIDQQEHLVFSYGVSFTENGHELPVVLYLIKNKTEFDNTVSEFNEQILVWLLIIFVLLIGVQLVWLSWTLKPLARFSRELEQIKSGHATNIKDDYPAELRQVTTQLNLLLKTEQNQRVRYRNSLADLAHSLKTPLAVMQTKTHQQGDVQAEINQINQTIEHQLKRAQSAGESSWRLGCDIKSAVDELIMALKKIYQEKHLTFTCDVQQNAVFKGDKADLTEILGNLLDNACKAASRHVVVKVSSIEHELQIRIIDDGIGMTAQQAEKVLQRGSRADTYEKGHGIGLAIVKDLVESYQGELTISRSNEYQGAQFLLSFSVLS